MLILSAVSPIGHRSQAIKLEFVIVLDSVHAAQSSAETTGFFFRFFIAASMASFHSCVNGTLELNLGMVHQLLDGFFLLCCWPSGGSMVMATAEAAFAPLLLADFKGGIGLIHGLFHLWGGKQAVLEVLEAAAGFLVSAEMALCI